MSNWHRIIWLDGKLRASAYPNCRTIAERFEISVRQAARDVEYMRDSLGAPLAYSPLRKGYYYREDTFTLPAVVLTDSQKKSLAYLAYRYEKTGCSDSLQLAELFHRLTEQDELTPAAMSGYPVPVHDLSHTEYEKFARLQEAIRLQSKVRLIYRSEERLNVMEYFAPMQLFPHGADNYVLGLDETEGRMRLICLRAVAEIRLRAERYAVSPLIAAGEVVPVAAEEPYSAVVTFSVPEWVFLLRHRYEHLEGRTFRIYYRDVERLASALLDCSCEFRVERPGWLRNMLLNRVRQLLHSL